MSTRPSVAVAGRPNVGKSSLVNRVVGHRLAVVEESPGVTRDRKSYDAEWNGIDFELVDTGGWLSGGDALDGKVSEQAERALRDATLILFVVDVTIGVCAEDEAAAAIALRAGPPVVLVVNKVDDANREGEMWEFLSLGLGDPMPVSALHGRGTGELLDEVVGQLQAATAPVPELCEEDDEETGETRVALVGRPNAGKSTLFNRLIGEERSVVHDLPGTTRDAIDTVLETEHGVLRFIDTAGMRRRSRTDYGTETYAVLRALDALDRADIAMLVIDASVGVTHQDQRLAERIGAAGCPAMVVVNKWDLITAEKGAEVDIGIADRLAFLGMAPVLKISARSGKGVHRILPALFDSAEDYHRRIPTGALNRAVRLIQEAHPSPNARIRYAVQGAIDPPTFTLFTNGRLHSTYLRYVERGLREQFDLGATPLRIRVRVGGGR